MAAITLDISFLHRPVWRDAKHCDYRIENRVDVWLIEASKNLHLLKSYVPALNTDEMARANRYLRQEDRDRFITSRASLRFILSKYTRKQPPDIVFEYGPNRKPYIPGSHIQYNLSDSGYQVLIAISRYPVGVDVEYIKPTFYYDTILPLNFNQAEIDFINETDSSNRFFTLWTRKEAILKATGVGLTDHLKQITSLDGSQQVEGDFIGTQNNWKLLSFKTGEDYMATLASNPSVNLHNFYEFNPEEFSL